MHIRYCLVSLLAALMWMPLQGRAQDDFLTVNWGELRIDSVLPVFTHSYPLGRDFGQYDYEVRVEYPEFERVTPAEAARIAQMQVSLPEMPEVQSFVGIDTKQGTLHVEVIPVVWREGAYQRVTSMKLALTRKPKVAPLTRAGVGSEASSSARYTDSSVLAQGRWVKIRVTETGVYQITHKELAAMGFNNPEKVRLYGQGGRMLAEKNIHECVDDLKEVPLYRRASDVLFYAHGTVTWKRGKMNYNFTHTQNTYSREACYFLTEDTEGTPLPFAKAEAMSGGGEVTTFPDYALYENDSFHWLERGRIFFEAYDYKNGRTKSYTFNLPDVVPERASSVKVSFGSDASTRHTVSVAVNEAQCGTLTLAAISGYTLFQTTSNSFTTTGKLAENSVVKVTHNHSSASGHLDYIELNYTRQLKLHGAFTCFRSLENGRKKFSVAGANANTIVWKIADNGASGCTYTELPGTYADNIYKVSDNKALLTDEYVALDASATFPSVEVVGVVENQDLHALTATDMVIVVPASATWISQAERLAELHRQNDSLRVVVVRADQIYNEFSSGNPDATAIRRFMKMFYDRAESDADLPKHLLLFGPCTADNRMISESWKRSTPDDYLPCFQSENSASQTVSYVMEEYFCLLDDGEGTNWQAGKADASVGRLPVHTLAEATIVVDKIEAYIHNSEAGAWRSKVCLMGDDGDNNGHMKDADDVAIQIQETNPDMIVEKVYWDAFQVEQSSTGNRYPEVVRRIREISAEGALMMNYSGHGRADELSHELVWGSNEMAALSSPRLPLWVTAACDAGPIDLPEENMCEIALLNEKGGAIAVLGTTRSTYRDRSMPLNRAFCKYLFTGKYTMGEALRLAKNETVSSTSVNNLHFVLLGDPALRLAVPNKYKVQITEVNGKPVTSDAYNLPKIKAGARVTMKGRVVDTNGNKASGFHGLIYPSVYDSKEKITCNGNADDADDAGLFEYWDYSRKLFSSCDSVRGGEFTFSFPVPLDISYSDENGSIFLYARSESEGEGQGSFTDFLVGGTEEGLTNDSIGPEIKVAFNSADFTEGGKTNETPLLMISLHDEDGINAAGTGVGHDLIAIVDNDPQMTFVLNNYYTTEAGDYTRGSATYSLPEMEAGQHTLLVRAWDVLNNSNTVEIPFEVVTGLRPSLTNVWCTESPARTSTTFVVVHDRPQTELTVKLEVLDFAGRILWQHTEEGSSSGNEYRVTWDLTSNDGQPVSNGIYLYRATISSAGGSESTKARKIAVIRQ